MIKLIRVRRKIINKDSYRAERFIFEFRVFWVFKTQYTAYFRLPGFDPKLRVVGGKL